MWTEFYCCCRQLISHVNDLSRVGSRHGGQVEGSRLALIRSELVLQLSNATRKLIAYGAHDGLIALGLTVTHCLHKNHNQQQAAAESYFRQEINGQRGYTAAWTQHSIDCLSTDQ